MNGILSKKKKYRKRGNRDRQRQTITVKEGMKYEENTIQ